MLKKILILSIFLATIHSAQAFEDCVISTDGKLSDISIENNDIIDIYPLITVMNEKNTLIVHPLKEGKTRFCILKNGKRTVMFNVEVTPEKTVIDNIDGFEILQIDEPPENYEYELDIPPGMSGGKTWIN